MPVSVGSGSPTVARSYEFWYEVGVGSPEGIVEAVVSSVRDRASNEMSVATVTSVDTVEIDATRPAVSYVDVDSTNARDELATIGDTITVRVSLSEYGSLPLVELMYYDDVDGCSDDCVVSMDEVVAVGSVFDSGAADEAACETLGLVACRHGAETLCVVDRSECSSSAPADGETTCGLLGLMFCSMADGVPQIPGE